nr:septin-2 isoform X2 [Pelodiscus sinensis]XP_014425111.1 septin-2 isoform X2 [Pelodiscus sinensis]XP_025036523.1 septin-2 isoform X2 [Pelodiscus sinensis]|eukprot:XP_006110692.1 septin-2 isoform X2 [Pelodiscus sinensis]
MVAAVSRLPFEHVTFVAHSLQRSISVALNDGGFENMIAKCRKLVGHFKHSPANSTELGIQQAANGQKQEPLVQDISTRWNSTLAMIQCLLCKKTIIMSTLNLQKHHLSVPTDKEFEKLQKLKKPCRFVIELLEGMGGKRRLYVSCSMVLPAFCHIFQVMAVSDDDNPAYVVRFKNTFTTYFTKHKESTNLRFLKIATALDPSFQNLKCLPKSEGDEVWNILSEVLKEQSSDAETRETEPPKKPKSNFCWWHLIQIVIKHNPSSAWMHVLWNGGRSMKGHLAHKYLATPATTVPCENTCFHYHVT